jgi:prepilin-type N-terminal cleavage/methylation domain-containing protein
MMKKPLPGFTLIELLVVMSIISLLLTIALPRYFERLRQSEETVLKHDLAVMREAIDQYYADRATYPDSLQTLVEARYLKAIPPDPITGVDSSWLPLPPADGSPGVGDVRSGAAGQARDGTRYMDW